MASWFHRPLAVGSEGADVALIQRRLRTAESGYYGPETAARVRAVQRRNSLPVTGIVDEATSDCIGESSRRGLVPQWFLDGDQEALALMLGHPDDLDAAVRRLQSSIGIKPTGVVDEAVAIAIGDDVPLSYDSGLSLR